MVGNKEVRLFGIDAPEYDQNCQKIGQDWSCGAAAANGLAQLVNGKTVVCSSVGMDDHQRVLGRCMVGATDINRAMVASGYAVAYRRYSSDHVSAEDSAKVSKRGLWAGTFQLPSDYRHAGDAPVPVRESAPKHTKSKVVSSNERQGRASGNCNIKGNRNRKGQWIYHMPGMPYFDQTRAEQIFLYRGGSSGGRLSEGHRPLTRIFDFCQPNAMRRDSDRTGPLMDAHSEQTVNIPRF